MLIKKSARILSVSESTPRDRVKRRVKIDLVLLGPDPLFQLDEEACHVEHLRLLASVGYGYMRAAVVDLASNYALFSHKKDVEHPLSL